MQQDFDRRSDQPDADGDPLPSVEDVIERLERLWAVAPQVAGLDVDLRGLKFGRYQLLQLQGQGAFGVVYRARDTQLHREVAIKIPRAQVLADEEKRRRFEAEASTAAMLDHKGIVTVYEADLTSPTPYIASAFCPGPDLGEWLSADHAAVLWSDAATFVAELADAVEYAHQKGVYHRDLKPSNVLLAPRREEDTKEGGGQLGDYQPKITDFGLAKLAQVTAAETRSSLLLGTPLYMAPEQLESSRGAPPAAADVYSLGCLLYELVAGRPPIEGDSYIQILDRLREQPPAPLRRLVPAAPRDLERISAKCLEKDPAARYASAGDLASDLHACVDGAPIQGREAGWVSRIKYWSTRPQRIRDAGWYMLCVQLLLTIWLSVVSIGAYFIVGMPLTAFEQVLVDTCVFVFAIHLPMAVVGWFTTRQHRWAVYTGFFLSLFNVLAPAAFFIMPSPPLYADIYSRIAFSEYVAFLTCTLVLFAELGQVALYAAAIAAWRRLSKGQRHDSTT
jgi:eukaryotic-like serine/threonine-protein kinase